jgi:hypothetical protein
MFELLYHQNREADYQGSLLQKDGSPFVLGPTDQLRFTLGRESHGLVLLDLWSGFFTPAGSTLTITSTGSPGPPVVGATYTVHIGGGDLGGNTPGAYDAEILVIPSGGLTEEVADIGIIHLLDTLPSKPKSSYSIPGVGGGASGAAGRTLLQSLPGGGQAVGATGDVARQAAGTGGAGAGGATQSATQTGGTGGVTGAATQTGSVATAGAGGTGAGAAGDHTP